MNASLLSRRSFLARGLTTGSVALFANQSFARSAKVPFEISLAQWSYHKAFFGQNGVEKLDPLKFAEIAKKKHGIEGIEYVNQFYKAQKTNEAYLKDLKKVADDNGVNCLKHGIVEQFSVVREAFGLGPFLSLRTEILVVDIADRDDFHQIAGLVDVAAALATNTDAGDVQFAVRIDR
jgi:hypothetical protein